MLAHIFDEVHTKRLVLRRPTADDGAALFRIHGDPATYRYSPRQPDPDQATSEKDLQEWLSDWQDEGYGYWTVILPSVKEVIGFGGISCMHWRDRDVLNLYYRFTPNAWGHGYATEMAQAAIHLARTHLPQLPIVARIRDINVASKRVAERAGLLRRPDLDTEHVIFALGWSPSENPR